MYGRRHWGCGQTPFAEFSISHGVVKIKSKGAEPRTQTILHRSTVKINGLYIWVHMGTRLTSSDDLESDCLFSISDKVVHFRSPSCAVD